MTDTETPAQDAVAAKQEEMKAAKLAVTNAKATARTAKTEASKAGKAFDAATKAQEGKEGDELKAAKASTASAKTANDTAQAAFKDAEQAVKDAEARVSTLKTEIDAARTAAKTAKDAERAAAKETAEAEKKRKAEERANRPRKASLTLSQRRALLKLQSQGTLTPTTSMNRTPLDYLVSVGLAETSERTTTVEVQVPNPKAGDEGEPKTVAQNQKVTVVDYKLSELGSARAKEINPKWETWKPDVPATATPATPASASTPTADQPVAA